MCGCTGPGVGPVDVEAAREVRWGYGTYETYKTYWTNKQQRAANAKTPGAELWNIGPTCQPASRAATEMSSSSPLQ